MASIYDKSILSSSDLERLDTIISQWKDADEEKKKDLHKSAEAIRNSYGYSGGGDGHGFSVTDSALFTSSMAGNAYTDALKSSADISQKEYEGQLEAAQKSGDDRLREAYIKNMQDTLGIGQKLKSAGITGGATESTVAYLNNVYNTSRQDIIEDTEDAKNKIKSDALKDKAESQKEIAKAELDSVNARADAIRNAEETAYQREQDALDRELKERELEHKISSDNRDFEYKKETDNRNFEYNKAQDEYAKQQAKNKSSSASSSSKSGAGSMSVSNILSLIKAGVYRDDFAEALGISKEELEKIVKSYSESEKRDMAWKLLQNGVYHESFPELLDYPEDALRNYANSYLLGY